MIKFCPMPPTYAQSTAHIPRETPTLLDHPDEPALGGSIIGVRHGGHDMNFSGIVNNLLWTFFLAAPNLPDSSTVVDETRPSPRYCRPFLVDQVEHLSVLQRVHSNLPFLLLVWVNFLLS
jgi:hypothetical protein